VGSYVHVSHKQDDVPIIVQTGSPVIIEREEKAQHTHTKPIEEVIISEHSRKEQGSSLTTSVFEVEPKKETKEPEKVTVVEEIIIKTVSESSKHVIEIVEETKGRSREVNSIETKQIPIVERSIESPVNPRRPEEPKKEVTVEERKSTDLPKTEEKKEEKKEEKTTKKGKSGGSGLMIAGGFSTALAGYLIVRLWFKYNQQKSILTSIVLGLLGGFIFKPRSKKSN